MHDEFEAFFQDPTSRRYRRARRLVLGGKLGQLRPLDLTELATCHARGRYVEVCRRVAELPPCWLLSPRVHYFAAHAAMQLGDQEEMELERFLFSACLQGIQATGDGSPERPYLVTYSTDVRDLTWALRQEVCSQQLVSRGRGCYDRILCADGSETWFDVTDAVRDLSPAFDLQAAVPSAFPAN